MALDDDEFHDREARLEAEQRRRIHDDLANEMAGRETGRIKRLDHPGEEPVGARDRKEKEERERAASLTRLQVLLNDPAYRALYNDTFDQLRAAEAATEAALQDAHDALSQAETDLQSTLDSATRLPDGTRVFRDAVGNIRTEDGEIVSGPDAETIVWKGGEPSYEELLARRKAEGDARQRVEELLRYQNDVLGPARDRMEDPHNPPTPDELKQIQDEIRAGAEALALGQPESASFDRSGSSVELQLPGGSPT
ncbi:hypothetical protein [Thalassobaculum litoreum]|uniref:Uncharacterized protein n=1 Tax=Thalassobaculum litoreum DSM 18839 TaxID=1123362 RepID=A0A8G2BMS4_9PROT|nr:hypothetical protein [Thalassobaculum litoreum]SDG59429.1 hypothetical protein SAMN05660686_04967 [Thalassobaculum litoreum DSM 18839]